MKVWGIGFLLRCWTSSYDSWKVFTYKTIFCIKWTYFLPFLQWWNKLFSEYGQGGALGLATYLRIGSNLEIWQVRKIRGRPQYFRMTHYTEILDIFLTIPRLSMMCDAFFKQGDFVYNLKFGGWYLKLVIMNKRYIRKHDFSKWLKVFRNTKKGFFTIHNASIVKKRHKKRLGLWKCRCNTLWSVNVENASMILHWIFDIPPHSTPFLHNDSSIYHRILHFYMSRIPPCYDFLTCI